MQPSAFTLGEWQVEPNLKRLSRAGKGVAIEPKTMAVLVYLASRPGEVVTADAIIENVWGNRQMGDNPVYKCIAKLRRVLGDDAQSPQYIATVTKMGYRLIATVTSANGATPLIDNTDAIVEKKGSTDMRRLVTLAIGGGFLLGIVLTASLSWKSSRLTTGPQQLLSTFPGSHSAASFSPDSRVLAFVNSDGTMEQIWLMDLQDPVPKQLTFADEPSERPRWTPDGERILFSRAGGIWAIGTDGSDEQLVVQNGRNASVSADGRRLAFERRAEIWISESTGQNQKRVSGVPEVDLLIVPRDPAISPDGRTIAFFHSVSGPLGDIWTIPADGGDAAQLTYDETFGGSPTWSPDGRHILFSSQRGGSKTLWRVPAKGGAAAPVFAGVGEDTQPSISPDGTSLVFTNTHTRFRLTRTYPNSSKSESIYDSPRLIAAPAVSPDGQQVAYFAIGPDSSINLYTIPIDGGTPKAITREPGTTSVIPQWSADGERIYFYRTGAQMSYRSVPATGGASTEVVQGWDWEKENGARVDPTNGVIVYSRLDRGVPAATMFRNIVTGEESVYGGVLEWPRWSHNGEFLIGADFSNNHTPYRGDIAICGVATAQCRTLAREAHVPVFSPDETNVFYVRPTRAGQSLWTIPIDGSAAERKVADLEPLQPSGSFFDVANDGSVLWVMEVHAESQLWRTELQLN